MASESFVLGVPYIYLSPLLAGNMNYQSRNYPDQVYLIKTEEEMYRSVESIEKFYSESKDIFGERRRKEIEEKTEDPTILLKHFVDDYMKGR